MIEVNLDADAVQKAVVQAVVNSTIGEALKKAINEALKHDSYSSRTLVEKAVDEATRGIVLQVAREEMEKKRPEIAKWIQASLTDEVLSASVGRMVEWALSDRK